MGSIGLISKDKSKVEYISLTKTFEELCPIYMSFGMTYDEYWYGEPYRTKFYRECHKLKVKQKDEELWQQGMYIYEALCDVSPILHAFSKNGTKPLPYRTKPILSEMEENNVKENKEKEIENARLVARLHFEQWMKNTKKRFEKTQNN